MKRAPTRHLLNVMAGLTLIGLALPNTGHALGEGPSQPEAMQFEPVDATDLVNLATGDLAYTLPLFQIPGPSGGFPINLAYHSGIGPNQEATWVGLGWTLNPGAVNRTIIGYPDDYRADVVVARNEMSGFGGYNVGIGLSLSAGWGSLGLNLSYDSFSANYGVNAMGRLGPVYAGVGTAGLAIGVAGGVGLEGAPGVGAGGRAQVAITPAGELSGALSGSLNAPINTSLGFTLSTDSGLTGSMSVLSMTSSSQISVGAGQFYQTSHGFTLPILGFLELGLSSSEWGWWLDEFYLSRSYGYLYQGSYLVDPTPTVSDTFLQRYSSKKYERTLAGNNLLPAQDVYLVSAQGINGAFKPFVRRTYTLEDDLRAETKGRLRAGTVGTNARDDVVYRFLTDPGANFVTAGPAYAITGDHDVSLLFSDRFGSRPIEPTYDPVSGKLKAFTVQDADGKRYEFAQPVRTWIEHAWSNEEVSRRIGDRTVEDTLRSHRTMGTPYATNWLLTAVKGPDYVDRDADGEASPGDWGYWVKLHYQRMSRPQVWRSPFRDMGPGPTSNSVETASIGVRDLVYLRRIETPTHLALFRTSSRKDRRTPVIEREVALAGKLQGQSTPTNRLTTYIFSFPGDWRDQIQAVDDATEFFVLTYSQRVDDDWIAYDRKLRLSKELSVQTTNARSSQPGSSSYDWSIVYDGHNTVFTINVHNAPFRRNVYEANLLVNTFFTESYGDAERLDRIELYNKSDPFVTYNPQTEQWKVAPQATAIRAVRLDYDYSLCPATPNSTATAADGAAGGKLSLRSVEFLGLDGVSGGMPPYRFFYANGDGPGGGLNPSYHDHDWDNWGSYRDPSEGRGKYTHLTPQRKPLADRVGAWGLTEVRTPLGGSILIEYESDDYYYVSDYIDASQLAPETAEGTIESQAYQIRPFSADPNTVLLGVGSASGMFHDNNDAVAGEDFAPAVGLTPGRFVALIRTRPSGTAYGWPEEVNIRQLTDVRPYYREFLVEGPDPRTLRGFDLFGSHGTTTPGPTARLIRIFAGFVVRFDGDPLTLDPAAPDRRYFLKLYPRKIYGGGVRVRSLKTRDRDQEYKTLFTYETEDGSSSGVTASLPSHYGAAKHRFEGLPYPQRLKATRLYVHENPHLAAPTVIYSQVAVSNVTPDGRLPSGQTVYRFITARDHPPLTVRLDLESTGRGDTDRAGTTSKSVIHDRSSIYGKPESILQLEWTADGTLRPVRIERYSYGFSGDLHNHGRVLRPGHIPVALSERKPLGIVHERHRWENDWEWDTRNERILYNNGELTKLYHSAFNVRHSLALPTYGDPATSLPSGMLISSSRSLGWDALSGESVWSARDTSEGESRITRRTPAYWMYEGMRRKNMLKQVAQESVYRGTQTLTSTSVNLEELTFSPDLIVSSNVTTWSNWGNDIWRKNDGYRYDRDIDRAHGSAFSPFTAWNYLQHSFPSVTSDAPWRMVSNITRYNTNSIATEERHADGTYDAALYAFAGTLPIAIGENTTQRELHYLSFETDEGLHTHGSIAAHFADGEGRTGRRAIKSFWRGGAWYEFPGLRKFHEYHLSFWARKGSADIEQALELDFHGPGAIPAYSMQRHLTTEDEWEYFRVILVPTENATVRMSFSLEDLPGSAGKFHYVDDVRLHPIDSRMTTFTYDALTEELITITDETSVSSFYEYDPFGRLIRTRDHDRNVIDMYRYHYRDNP